MKNNSRIQNHEQAWRSFIEQQALSAQQEEQCATYLDLLLEWNERINLTAITSVPDAISYHLADSLALNQLLDLSQVHMLCDVGSGGGLPGIPLAIAHPHLRVVLIEVIGKKVDFLRMVIKTVGIEDRVEVAHMDWRTFLRTTNFPLDVVCARASLRPDELIRMFGGASAYANAQLVYWASASWQLEGKEQRYFKKEVSYTVDEKERKLMLFAQ